eukprot:770912-Alexandrium_andersonii.AAC.1
MGGPAALPWAGGPRRELAPASSATSPASCPMTRAAALRRCIDPHATRRLGSGAPSRRDPRCCSCSSSTSWST